MKNTLIKFGLFTAILSTTSASIPFSSQLPLSLNNVYAATITTNSCFFDFETDTDSWEARVPETVDISTEAAYQGSQSLKVTNRASTWNGPSCNITSLLEEGKTYHFSAWVMYDAPTASSTQTLTMSLACTPTGSRETYKNLVSKPVNKGNWTV